MNNKLTGILKSIQEALESFELPVWYGRTFTKDYEKWDYFVFNRTTINKSGKNKMDFNYNYQVHIIMEDYIPEGFEMAVINAITTKTKLKLADSPMQFNYVKKNNVDMVVEMITIEFTKAFKGCDINV